MAPPASFPTKWKLTLSSNSLGTLWGVSKTLSSSVLFCPVGVLPPFLTLLLHYKLLQGWSCVLVCVWHSLIVERGVAGLLPLRLLMVFPSPAIEGRARKSLIHPHPEHIFPSLWPLDVFSSSQVLMPQTRLCAQWYHPFPKWRYPIPPTCCLQKENPDEYCDSS